MEAEMFSLIGVKISGRRYDPKGVACGGRRAHASRLLITVLLAAVAFCAFGESVSAYGAEPTVTGVSPNTGPPAGGTTVTVTGSGFAIGGSGTRITFGEPEEVEATGVNCPATTECTATSPESSLEDSAVADVRATVGGSESEQTPADQFRYRGLFITQNHNRIPVGSSVTLQGFDAAFETSGCNGFVNARIVSNGEATDVLEVSPDAFVSCESERFFGDLPFSFDLKLNDNLSTAIEGPMGVRTGFGCVYEGTAMTGGVEFEPTLSFGAGATFPLVAEEEPGAECAGTEDVSVGLDAKQFSGLGVEQVAPPPPSVSGVSPNSGPETGGTSVTITGAELGEASKVKFGSVEAASFTVESPTSITAVSPPGTGTVDVTVTTPEGTSSSGSRDHFTYEAPQPAIAKVSPATGPEAGGTTVTVTGEHLTGATAVRFGATSATSFTVNSDSSVTAVSPGGTGTVDVSVTTPAGTSSPGAADRFTYEPTEGGLPEIGRCAKVTPVKEGKSLVYHGAYETSKCTTTNPTHHGKYEWTPGPGAGKGFTGTGKATKFETLHEVDKLGPFSRVSCESASEAGEFTGPRTAVATITFSSCVDVKTKATCQSSGQPAGHVQTGSLDGELGVIKGGELPVIGIAFRPHGSSTFTNIECGSASVIVEGAVIAPITAIDAMSTKHTLAYKGHEGAQAVAAFEGEPIETLSVGEPLSVAVTMQLNGAESLEVKAIA
jgi:hypothetical protein